MDSHVSRPTRSHNLAKSPDQAWITVNREEQRVVAESLLDGERARAWERVVSLAPGYRRYETTTDRQVPVIRLTPQGDHRG
ncbi:MAG: nitroreductase/quinone reductase family protein [Actinomycetota bacterium]